MSDTKYTTDFVYEVYSPKWKWFQPPIHFQLFGIPLFRWAYHIRTRIFTNVFPIAMHTGADAQLKSMEFEFTVKAPPVYPEIDAATSELRKRYMDWLNDVRKADDA